MRAGIDPFFPEGYPEAPAEAAPAAALPALVRPQALPTAPARLRAAPPLPDALALARALRGRWPVALVLGTVAAAAAGAAAWRLLPPPTFSASSLIEVKAEKPAILPGLAEQRNDLRVFQATQLALVRSRLVVHAALERPGVAALPTLKEQPDPVDWLTEALVAEFPSGSELLRVSLSGDRPADLAVIVNAVTEAYLDEVVSKDSRERQATAGKVKDLLDAYNEKLTRQRARLKELAESVGSDDKQTLALKQQMAVQQLGEEKKELLQVQTDLKRCRAELSVLRESPGLAGPEPPDPRLVDQAVEREPAVERLRLRTAELKGRLERVRRLVRSESDPSVREVRLALERARRDETDARAVLRPKIERDLREADQTDAARKVAELETRVRVLGEYEKVLSQEIGQLEGEAQAFNRQTLDLQWRKDEIAQGEEMARQLGKQIEALNVELKAPQRGRLIERAERPKAESPRKRLMGIGLAMLAAFGASAAGVAWREFRLRRVGAPGDVTDALGLRLVGTLPELPGPGRNGGGGGAGPPGRGAWEDRLVESIDSARAVLLRDCLADGLRTIQVTSAAKGEGKSSLSGHLAISLARTGRRTLLADFDLRSPSAHRLFDLPEGPGVAELLRGEASVEDVARPVSDDLDVVPAGRTDPAALRALGQPALPALLGDLAARYDFVVVDSAPLLPVADSLLISQHVDGVVLSVFREVSRLPAVGAGCERLEALGVRVLGAVVTGVPMASYGDEYRYASPLVRS